MWNDRGAIARHTVLDPETGRVRLDVQHGYDDAGRRVEKRVDHGGDGVDEVVVLTWDGPDGQLSRMESHDPDGATTGVREYVYDDAGRLDHEVWDGKVVLRWHRDEVPVRRETTADFPRGRFPTPAGISPLAEGSVARWQAVPTSRDTWFDDAGHEIRTLTHHGDRLLETTSTWDGDHLVETRSGDRVERTTWDGDLAVRTETTSGGALQAVTTVTYDDAGRALVRAHDADADGTPERVFTTTWTCR